MYKLILLHLVLQVCGYQEIQHPYTQTWPNFGPASNVRDADKSSYLGSAVYKPLKLDSAAYRNLDSLVYKPATGLDFVGHKALESVTKKPLAFVSTTLTNGETEVNKQAKYRDPVLEKSFTFTTGEGKPTKNSSSTVEKTLTIATGEQAKGSDSADHQNLDALIDKHAKQPNSMDSTKSSSVTTKPAKDSNSRDSTKSSSVTTKPAKNSNSAEHKNSGNTNTTEPVKDSNSTVIIESLIKLNNQTNHHDKSIASIQENLMTIMTFVIFISIVVIILLLLQLCFGYCTLRNLRHFVVASEESKLLSEGDNSKRKSILKMDEVNEKGKLKSSKEDAAKNRKKKVSITDDERVPLLQDADDEDSEQESTDNKKDEPEIPVILPEPVPEPVPEPEPAPPPEPVPEPSPEPAPGPGSPPDSEPELTIVSTYTEA